MSYSKHEVLKSHWIEIVKKYAQSGQSIKEWCEKNNILRTKFYYWQRVIREEALIKAGTLAVTGQAQFVEVKQTISEVKPKSNKKDTCAILRLNRNEIEILNGADPNTLETVLKLIAKQ